ncbi:MAG: FkbM family methyltransferase [Acetobacteraceae bacterium]|nr:FkbM family methyltransferase [Acetobacteraceae bacterium]
MEAHRPWLNRIMEFGSYISPIWHNMRSISFSQYAEDVLLHHLRPQKRGFYLDVGAYHPWMSSNTYKLYLKGWSGITIEPNPDVAQLFNRIRPRDTHLNIGISGVESELIYYRFTEANLNSFDAGQAARMNRPVIDTCRIRCLPLSEVINKYCPNQHIDLLSIDCEGLDLSAIESIDWVSIRPTAIIVEDFDQFLLNNHVPGVSLIRSYLAERNYMVAAQGIFSFIYVDRMAFARTGQTSGFRLDQSQLGGLAESATYEPANGLQNTGAQARAGAMVKDAWHRGD